MFGYPRRPRCVMTNHAQFAMGAGMQNALQDFDTRASTFSQVASDHALGFVKLLEERRTTEGRTDHGNVSRGARRACNASD
jgi:hypothetical protein